jgi:hypothetical protein
VVYVSSVSIAACRYNVAIINTVEALDDVVIPEHTAIVEVIAAMITQDFALEDRRKLVTQWTRRAAAMAPLVQHITQSAFGKQGRELQSAARLDLTPCVEEFAFHAIIATVNAAV